MRNILKAYELLNKKSSWTWDEINEAVSISTGNRKLKSSKDVKFLIWNLPAVVTCPYRTAMCSAACYAIKAEKAYPDVLPARNYNFELSKTDFFVDFMSRLFHEIAKKAAYKKAKWILVRIHESGDFYSVEYMKKWFDIAENCKDIKNMLFMAYTKSLPFYDTLKGNKPLNFVVRGSVWDDTSDEQLALIKKYNLPIYTAYEPGKFPKNYKKCSCVDCGKCQMCYKEENKLIACEIH